MDDLKRKGIDTFFNESDKFELQFVQTHDEGGNAAARQPLISEIVAWLQECASQGLFLPNGSMERRAFSSLLERWNSRLRSQGYFLEHIGRLADFDPTAGTVLNVDCPYPGLEPYKQNQSTSFFGREALVASSAKHLERPGNQILLIIGASGSGKSSVALAGILPQLQLHHQDIWLFGPTLSPGTHPLAALAKSVTEAIGHPDQALELQQGLLANPDKAFDQLALLCEDKPIMLLIDQFEELFTLCPDEAKKDAFAQVLCTLSSINVGKSGFSCKILLTMRSDHYGRFGSSKTLQKLHTLLFDEEIKENGEHIIRNRTLTAIGFKDIKQAIKKPADDVGLRFIPEKIIDELASQTAGLANGLPLLQFCLRSLWNNRKKNNAGDPLDMITEADIKALPDIENALGTVADRIYKEFSSSETLETICNRLFLELIVIDENFEEPLRRRRNESDLKKILQSLPVKPQPEEITTVINAFVEEGLLRRFGDGPNSQIEVAHEALLRRWSYVESLIANDKKRLHDIKEIGRQARDWVNHNKSADYLSLKGGPLKKAGQYAKDNWLIEPETVAYVKKCQRSNTIHLWTNVVLAIVVTGLIGNFIYTKRKEETEMKRLAAVYKLVSEGHYYLFSADYDTAEAKFTEADKSAAAEVVAKLGLGLVCLVKGDRYQTEGKVYNETEEFKNAEEYFTKAIHGTLNEEENGGPKNEILYTYYYYRGKSRLALGKNKEANADFLNTIKYLQERNPKDSKQSEYDNQLGASYEKIGLEYFSRGELAEAEKNFKIALAKGIGASAHISLGRVYLEQGRKREARNQFEMGIDQKRKIKISEAERAKNLSEQQNNELSGDQIILAQIDLSLNDPETSDAAKKNLSEAGKNLENAAKLCNQILQNNTLKPEDKNRTYILRGNIQEVLGNIQKMLGKQEEAQKKYKEAIKSFENVLKSNPYNSIVALYLANIYYKLNNIEDTTTYIKKAEEFMENDPQLANPQAKKFFDETFKTLKNKLNLADNRPNDATNR